MPNPSKRILPQEGFSGLKENFSADLAAGFVVFLLAMPLSLGIAKASDFPPAMGLISAIIGGILVSFFVGSRLTIKGPAAGLIVVVAGSVADFGGGIEGWRLALGAVLVAGLIQVLFGFFRLGKLIDIFPTSVVHGMLAAIGLIILIKQIPILLTTDPDLAAGLSIVETVGAIPDFLASMDVQGAMIGILSLFILYLWPIVAGKQLGRIPAPLLVLFVVIPIQLWLGFASLKPDYALLELGNLDSFFGVQVDFAGFGKPVIFGYYVAMFALVGTLESLLTVKAIDGVDPFRRKSNPDKDLIAIGLGNTLCGFLGGLPMISEVARSSANVNSGAKTRWANFFHGLFILIFVLLASPLIEMIPTAALAAMLIAVGLKLAHPREFMGAYRIGKEQFVIFTVTVLVTLFHDLLLGILAGMLCKVLIHLSYGVSIKSFFSASAVLRKNEDRYLLEVKGPLIFSNFLPIKAKLRSIPSGHQVFIELSRAAFVDHSVMENLELFREDYEETGGTFTLLGLENHKTLSAHPLAGRKL